MDSDPFDVEALSGGTALVADAAANALLVVDQRGEVDWVATFPNQTVPTDNAKTLFGCPGSGAPPCSLPAALPAQPVPTSIAVGPDGSYSVGELKGFPAPRAQIATGIPIVSAATVGRDGQVFVVKNALIPGAADVVALP